MRDVAEAAGVSAMSVSAVLHGTGSNVKVSPTTAENIRRVARELRYQPNHVARFLRSRRTNTVGLVFQHFNRLSENDPYFPQLLNGAIAALFPLEYTLALCPKLFQQSGDGQFSDGRFDGVLWARPDFTETSLDGIRHSTTPVVMLHAPPGSAPGVTTFCADNDGALRLVVQHLVELGHKKIAFVIDPVNEHTAEGRARTEAFRVHMSAAGLEPDVLVWNYDAPELARYTNGAGPHTALATFSDTLAGHLLRQCNALGIDVPRQLSIVGFDSSQFCERTRPRLTSVYQPVEQIAREATAHLLGLISRDDGDGAPPEPITRVYACRLDVRESTGSAG